MKYSLSKHMNINILELDPTPLGTSFLLSSYHSDPETAIWWIRKYQIVFWRVNKCNRKGDFFLSQSVWNILNPQFFPWLIKVFADFITEEHFSGSLGTFISISNPQFSTLPSGLKGQPKGTVNLTSICPSGLSLLMLTLVDVTCV